MLQQNISFTIVKIVSGINFVSAFKVGRLIVNDFDVVGLVAR